MLKVQVISLLFLPSVRGRMILPRSIDTVVSSVLETIKGNVPAIPTRLDQLSTVFGETRLGL